MNRSSWAPEWREEYDALLADVLTVGTNTHRRLDEFERLIEDARQAQRPWAREVERTCFRDGAANEVKKYQDRTRATVSHDGRLLNLPAIQGRKVKDSDGRVADDRALIEMWTWEQILDKRAETLRMQQSSADRLAYYDRLLALRELCPDSMSPHDAARRLGINLDEWLERAEPDAGAVA